MDIQSWIQNNKGKAAAIAGGGILFMMHRGHSASSSADITSSDGTADGATADGEHVQLVPVSVAPSDYSGNLDSVNPQLGDTSLQNDSGIPYPVSVGGDVNSPLVGATPTATGAEASGIIAATGAAIAANRPAGHPGYHNPKKPHHKPKPKPKPHTKPKPKPHPAPHHTPAAHKPAPHKPAKPPHKPPHKPAHKPVHH